MPFNPYDINTDQRVHINLTKHSWSIIENDMTYINTYGKENLSGMLNKIFYNYKDASSMSIGIVIDNLYDHYVQLFSQHKLPEENYQHIIKALISEKKENFIRKSMSFKKGEGRKFRINNENFLYLTDYSSECNEEQYYTTVGKYLKALFEDYANLPFVEREQILFSSIISRIKDAISNNHLIRFKNIDNMVFEVKPYTIQTDSLVSFNYLLCYSRLFSRDSREVFQPASFRLSRLNPDSVKIMKSINGRLTEKEKRVLEEKVDKLGVENMLGSPQLFKVRLTDKGIKMYNNMISFRPTFSKREGNDLTFYSTEFQIESYFFKFGEDAVVIEPRELCSKIYEKYSNAKRVYEEILET